MQVKCKSNASQNKCLFNPFLIFSLAIVEFCVIMQLKSLRLYILFLLVALGQTESCALYMIFVI